MRNRPLQYSPIVWLGKRSLVFQPYNEELAYLPKSQELGNPTLPIPSGNKQQYPQVLFFCLLPGKLVCISIVQRSPMIHCLFEPLIEIKSESMISWSFFTEFFTGLDAFLSQIAAKSQGLTLAGSRNSSILDQDMGQREFPWDLSLILQCHISALDT